MAPKKGKAPKKKALVSKLEPITVRVSPTVKWTLELLARQMRKPLSRAFEMCVDVASRLVEAKDDVGGVHQIANVALVTGAEGNEVDRILNLAWHAPSLMTHEERAVYEAIKRSPELWSTEEIERFDDQQRQDLARGEALAIATAADKDYLLVNFEALMSIAVATSMQAVKPPVTRAAIALERQALK